MSLLDNEDVILERMGSNILSSYVNNSGGRRSGRTTRLVWYYINKYFDIKENEEILIRDHYNTFGSNELLLKQIIERLRILTIQQNIDYDINIRNWNIYIKKRKINLFESKLSCMNDIIAKSLDNYFNKGIIKIDDFNKELNNWKEINYKKIMNSIRHSLLYELGLSYNYMNLNYKNKTVQNLIFK